MCQGMNGASNAATDTNASTQSPFRFKQPKAKVLRSPTDAGYSHPGCEVTPAYTIIHQGKQDLADAWSDPKVRSCSVPDHVLNQP